MERQAGNRKRRALVVRGGWEGHEPIACTERFLPFLRGRGFAVTVTDALDGYADPDLLRGTDLIVQCWSEGQLTGEQEAGLCAAVRSGTGFAGWHGGVVSTMQTNLEYQFMVGGRFVCHPGGIIDYTVDTTDDHPTVAGLGSFQVHSEQYFCHVDPTLDVHATTTFDAGHGVPEAVGAVMPVVWTRSYGAGRVFVSTLGHVAADFDQPETREHVQRGLLWAARQK
ncbi:MAG: ThuA domain-containing protein [Dactylosporangium sp.]|nr:ThuA domain-containing protein [Dactylosporangium sp.]NNJ61026.1 ThuA domain-containing protein [Dactylosporangium sp.]